MVRCTYSTTQLERLCLDAINEIFKFVLFIYILQLINLKTENSEELYGKHKSLIIFYILKIILLINTFPSAVYGS